MATRKGQVKKTSLEQYSRPRANGINAITIREGDELLEAKLTKGNSHVIMAVKSGKAIRSEENKTRPNIEKTLNHVSMRIRKFIFDF